MGVLKMWYSYSGHIYFTTLTQSLRLKEGQSVLQSLEVYTAYFYFSPCIDTDFHVYISNCVLYCHRYPNILL